MEEMEKMPMSRAGSDRRHDRDRAVQPWYSSGVRRPHVALIGAVGGALLAAPARRDVR